MQRRILPGPVYDVRPARSRTCKRRSWCQTGKKSQPIGPQARAVQAAAMHNLMPRLLQVETAVASSEGRNREWTEDQRSKPVEASSYIHIRSFRTRTLDRAVRQRLQRQPRCEGMHRASPCLATTVRPTGKLVQQLCRSRPALNWAPMKSLRRSVPGEWEKCTARATRGWGGMSH